MISTVKSPMVGRPSKFTSERFESILKLLIEGKSLNQIGQLDGMPTKQTIINWLNNPNYSKYLEAYQQTREIQAALLPGKKGNKTQTATLARISAPAKVYDLDKHESKVIQLKQNFEVSTDSNGLLSLTDLWKSAGSKREQAPNFWINQDSTKQLIEFASGVYNATQDCIIKTKKGKGGATYAHKQIALAYAKYLSPELHLAVNHVFFERIAEEKNPELSLKRGVENYRKKGKSDLYIQERFEGILTRKKFTATLKAHGVEGIGYGKCTSGVYFGIYGGDTNHARAKKNLPSKANIRENVDEIELSIIRVVELTASKNIEKFNIQGNDACEAECKRVSKLIASSVSKALNAA